ncbi:uncharacterized protein LOC114076469 [Solanum pennellii]|uniref:Uncharacterized protein LOC114076469 n=1 Tax=Solanum pennellii TaxID=28526 RepID=A0ABM1V6J0_SOLPN|nr:uncharacterized protein LOC114076469 [Solanum pennellii]
MCPPIKIHNDVGVKVFLGQMRMNLNFFTKYPLCITLKDREMYNEGHWVVIIDRINSDVRLSQTNIDLYSNNSIRLIGMNLDGVVNDNSEIDNDVICDHCNLFVPDNQIYNNREILKEVMRHVGLVEKFSFRVARCNASNYHLNCISKTCSWMMRASSLNKSNLFKVRKYIAQHTCSVRERVYARRQGITDVVAVLIMEKYIDPSTVYTPKDIAEDMLKLHCVSLTYIHAWRAKEKAIKLVRGDPAESYARLPGYFYILEQTYSGFVLKIKRKEGDKFLYAFVALEACIRGWKYCRSIVVVDGAGLKCSYGGTMLTASTMDPGGKFLFYLIF